MWNHQSADCSFKKLTYCVIYLLQFLAHFCSLLKKTAYSVTSEYAVMLYTWTEMTCHSVYGHYTISFLWVLRVIMCSVKWWRFVMFFEYKWISQFKKMSIWSLTYQQSTFNRYLGDKHFSEFLPTRHRQKSTGIDTEQNYVTVYCTWFCQHVSGLCPLPLMFNTHNRLTALFPGLPGWVGTRK